jgi:hypothetical protein
VCDFCSEHIDSLDALQSSLEKGTAIIELLDTALSAGIEVSPRVVSCALSAAHQHLQVSEKINRSLQIGCGSKEVLRLVD